jgi:hypothetical protein
MSTVVSRPETSPTTSPSREIGASKASRSPWALPVAPAGRSVNLTSVSTGFPCTRVNSSVGVAAEQPTRAAQAPTRATNRTIGRVFHTFG